MEHVADRVGILLTGKLAVQDRVDTLEAAALRELEFTFAEPVSAQRFTMLPGVRQASAHGTTVHRRVAPAGRIIGGSVLAGLLARLFGCLGLAVGTATGRRGVALATGIGIAVVTYLIASLADWLRPWQTISPVHLASLSDALTGQINVLGTLAVLLTAALLVGAATTMMRRRDIRTV